jgi:curved DNA-binding protein CbpA
MPTDDPYEVLGVPRDADIAEIRKAYKNLARKLHPDKIGSNIRALEQMKLVNEAYAVLSNKKARDIFDDDEDWKCSATEATREKVWKDYSKQVEEYYRQVQSYLETELSSIQVERNKLSGFEQSLSRRETELKEKEQEFMKRFKKREEYISKKESELDELMMLISRSNSIVVDLVQASKALRNR